MRSKRFDKKELKIVAATSLVIFTLLASLSATFSWFKAYTTVGYNAENFGVWSDSSAVTAKNVYFVKYDGVYGGMASKLTNENHSLVMSEYDYIFTDRNVNTPLFIRVELEGFDSTKNLTVEVPCLGDYKTGTNAYVNNWLSNVICVKFSYGLQSGSSVVKDTYTFEENTINGGVAKTVYEGMRDRAVSLPGTPFVTDATEGTKDKIVSIQIPKNTIPSSFVTDGKTIVYLEFDYYVTSDVNLVRSYITSYDTVIEEPNRIFTSDIGTIILRDSD